MIEVSSTLFKLQIQISRFTHSPKIQPEHPENYARMYARCPLCTIHEDCIKHTDILAEYYGALQLAECCKLQKKINILVCSTSPSAVNYDRKSILWCAATHQVL